MKKALMVLLICLTGAGILPAQDPIAADSLTRASAPPGEDSLTLADPPKEGFFKRNYPDPMKAGIMSLVIPGSGQIYNKSWWKVPLVYGALGGMVYLIQYNSEQYNRLETAYRASLNDEEHEFSGTAIDNPQSLRNIRDGFDKNRQLSWVGFVFVYILNGMEAFVDAHLQNFNIDDDLSLRLHPVIELAPGSTSLQPVMGLGVTIPLSSPGKSYRSFPAHQMAR